MAYAEMSFMGENSQILLERFSRFVNRYPAPELAEWFGCTEKTAEHFRAGTSWPNARHWRMIVRTFGRDIWTAVFEPEVDETLARLRREQRELEERLEAIKARRRQALGGVVELEERSFAGADRAQAVVDGPPNGDLFEDLQP